MFFHFDGVDGTGKSTQIELFCQWLRALGHEVVTCRDPGSTELGERIREILLDMHDLSVDRRSEMLLYMAARAQLVAEIIRPALAAGKMVVTDRFLLANIVYQGHAGGLEVEPLWQVGQIATGGLTPTLTFVLDMDVETAMQRLHRSHDRIESQGLDYLRQVREGFLTEARQQTETIVVVDANRPIADVHDEIRHAAQRVLSRSSL